MESHERRNRRGERKKDGKANGREEEGETDGDAGETRTTMTIMAGERGKRKT